MSDRVPLQPITPALTLEEWTAWHSPNDPPISERGVSYIGEWADSYPALIALANAALPGDDPRKITRSTVIDLRMAASSLRHECGQEDEDAANLERIASALAAFLPLGVLEEDTPTR
jgi:hypothetical protein